MSNRNQSNMPRPGAGGGFGGMSNRQQQMAQKLILSLIVDGIGAASYILPGLGEGADVAWAPISAMIVQQMYGSYSLSALNFFEELLPFTGKYPSCKVYVRNGDDGE
eukprot:Clim_evm51s225 gene=Clim_evmTU51s225